jgi:hypothetical protein
MSSSPSLGAIDDLDRPLRVDAPAADVLTTDVASTDAARTGAVRTDVRRTDEHDDGVLVVDDDTASAPDLRVGPSSIHGTGVFALVAFEPEQIIERCPVLVVPAEQALTVADTVFGDYVYEWEDGYALALGFGSLYNHDRASNARYEMDYDAQEIHVVAERAIPAGTEVTVNYNGDPTDPSPVWFE